MSTNVDVMPAGRELDALVAEKVMECKLANCDDMGRKYVGCFNAEHHHKASGVLPSIPCYSTDIAAAWEVVEKLKANGSSWWFSDCNGPLTERDTHQHGRTANVRKFCYSNTVSSSYADTMPLAICRAALKAVGT